MPFGSKIAASHCGAESSLSQSTSEVFDVAEEPSSSLMVSEASDSEGTSERPIQDSRGKSCLYNLIKSLAKVEDVPSALSKLSEAASRPDVDLDKKNSKGSTALHACAYLRRWDLAQILMDAGADPLVKNAAGHTFFLCAVKDEAVPWRDLFKSHSELLEKHQRYLERGRGKVVGGRAKAGEHQADVHKKIEAKNQEPNRAIGKDVSSGEARARIGAMLDQGAVDFASLEAIEGGVASLDLDLLARLVKIWPSQDLARLFEEGLSIECGRFLIAKFMSNDNLALESGWTTHYGRYRPVLGVEEYLQRLLTNGRFEDIKLAVLNGMRASEDFIEECEERALYDLADYLIDHNSENPVHNAVQSTAPSTKNPGKSKSGKKSSAQRSNHGASSDKKRPAAKRAKSKRPSSRASKIANLDGPLKEANEFEYQEKKAPAKATIVIVKRARPLMTRGDLASD